MTDRKRELAERVVTVRTRVDRACEAAGRRPQDVTLVAVTKFFPAEDAALLAQLGCSDLGESREQEAAPKVARCAELLGAGSAGSGAAEPGTAGAGTATVVPRWHMLGRIQRNKASAVARWAHSAHSVDSIRLADALAKGVVKAVDEGERTDPLRVFLQVSLDDDPQRGGVSIDDLGALADRVASSDALSLAGLMAIAPLRADPGAAFDRLAETRQRLRRDHPDADGLSAGMSGDFEQAIAHGSTCVRVGTAIMGPRPIISR